MMTVFNNAFESLCDQGSGPCVIVMKFENIC